jgi:predicted nucleic acid-binding protein
MMVVDTNILIYLAMDMPQTEAVKAWAARDPDWCVPGMAWTELANTLAGGVRASRIAAPVALGILQTHRERVTTLPEADTLDVLQTALATGLTAYDAEFVVAARRAGLKLLTNDPAVLRACPDVAVALDCERKSAKT